MDLTLERIISLLPRKPDGKFVHGAKTELADVCGISHNVIADWIAGRNKSYTRYLYEIASKYGVTVEWLKGETDEKTPPAPAVSAVEQEAIELLKRMNNEELMKLVQLAKIVMGEK